MVDIGTSDKLINLWPTPPSRPIERSGQKQSSLKEHQHNKKEKNENEIVEDGPGTNIDEYV